MCSFNLKLPCISLNPGLFILSLQALVKISVFHKSPALLYVEGPRQASPETSLLHSQEGMFSQPVCPPWAPVTGFCGPPRDLLCHGHEFPELGSPEPDTEVTVGSGGVHMGPLSESPVQVPVVGIPSLKHTNGHRASCLP